MKLYTVNFRYSYLYSSPRKYIRIDRKKMIIYFSILSEKYFPANILNFKKL